jgi:hypothetical protein
MRSIEDFIGVWAISRGLTHADGTQARFNGQAELRRDGAQILYVESGELHMPGAGAFRAERRYTWDDQLNVYFDDGRFFHQIPAQGGDAAHWCDPDQYDVTYDFSNWPRWQAVWRVRGPRKEYVSDSWYARV